MQKKFAFSQYVNLRKNLIKENSQKSFVVQGGAGVVMLSAPHGVSQVRLGRRKIEEPGSLSFMLEIAKRTGAPFIAKTKNCNDDANFDEKSKYKTELNNFIKQNNIKFLLDFHGLNKRREVDINFGTHLGQNVKNDEKLFDDLNNKICRAGFYTSIDNPFWAGPQTISGAMAEQTKIWTLQVEINYKITNEKENVAQLQNLIEIFVDFVNDLNKNEKI